MSKRSRNSRVLFPATGFTVGDAVDYYAEVARFLVPHLKGRPLSFRRYPGTIDDEAYWEKDAPAFTPDWVRRAKVPRRNESRPIDYIVIDSKRGLEWLASIGGIELHPFLHSAPRLEEAQAVIFDLDPGTGSDIVDCCRVALLLKDGLEVLGLAGYAKTTGSKGLQVQVPLHSRATHEQTELFARAMADAIARAKPQLVVSKMTKSLRTNRVFIDWSQNADYKTNVSVYSLRTKRPAPYVSMPLRWEEVERVVANGQAASLYFSPDEALARLKKVGDLFAPVLKKRQKLPDIGPVKQVRRTREKSEEVPAVIRGGIRLPQPKTQSGRRLFVLPKTEMGNELWLEREGRFTRWILRPDREGSGDLIAMPAGNFPVEAEYFAGRVPPKWKGRVTIDDAGAYETFEVGDEAFTLFFEGQTLAGFWRLEKIEKGERHRSWRFAREKA